MVQAFISKVFLILIQILTELEHINISFSVSPDSRIQESEFAEGGTEFAHELASLLRFLLKFMEFCNPAAIPHTSQLENGFDYRTGSFFKLDIILKKNAPAPAVLHSVIWPEFPWKKFELLQSCQLYRISFSKKVSAI